MEVKFDRDGTLNTRLYRKPQKKLLTLNANSHHPALVKAHTVANMYSTAELVSSNETNTLYSVKMTDELLLNNGYDQLVLDRIKENLTKKNKKKKKKKTRRVVPDTVATLKIPHLSDQCTAQIKRAVEQYNIPVRVVSTPGQKLRNLLTSSKPLDKAQCPELRCRACACLVKGRCTDRNVVYEITCIICSQKYNGETGRPLGQRFNEHYLSAANPTAPSYKDKPLAKHYSVHHPGITPNLSLTVLEHASSTNNRKIREARLISKNKPSMNCRAEQAQVMQFLV